jgi:hypothetical protein
VRVLINKGRSASELRRVVRDALAALEEALGFPDRDSLSDRARHLLGIEHYATLAMASAASGDWRASSSHLLHALEAERHLLGEAGPLRTALTRECIVAA